MRRLGYFIVGLSLVACNKDELGPQTIDNSVEGEGGRIMILNEGNFGWGNGSVSVYRTGSGSVENQVFNAANGFAVGDVAQSAVVIDDKIYIVVNNSGKIEVLDQSNYQVVGTITGFNSPRYMAELSANKSYVSDLYSNSIQILDPSAFQVTGSIQVGYWTEEMTVFNGDVYVSLPDERDMLVIDGATDQITDTIHVRKGAGKLLQDLNGNGWLMCSGGINEDLPILYKFNLQTNQITDSLEFNSVSESPASLQINASKDSLFFINSGVFAMSVNDQNLPTSPILQGQAGQTFYALYVDSMNRHVYVSDAKDYIQNSVIYEITSQGVVKNSFTTGIISGCMLRVE